MLALFLTHALCLQLPALLSDVQTPALLIDVHALERQFESTGGPSNDTSSGIPSFRFHNDNEFVLRPASVDPERPHKFDSAAPEADCHLLDTLGICYMHSRVVQSRDVESGRDNTDASLFLAKLDLNEDWELDAQLVLGLNNHHVGSYYWARTAGAGAAMEAPGVALLQGNCLQWQNEIVKCNSNDGKRSEWVNFLRPGDQVQLVLKQASQTIRQLLLDAKPFPSKCNGTSSMVHTAPRLFGISSRGRPLGSEPAVVGEWVLHSP